MDVFLLDGNAPRPVSDELIEYCKSALGEHDVLSIDLFERVRRARTVYIPAERATIQWDMLRCGTAEPPPWRDPDRIVLKFLMRDTADVVCFRGMGGNEETDYEGMNIRRLDIPGPDHSSRGVAYLLADVGDSWRMEAYTGQGSLPAIGFLARWEGHPSGEVMSIALTQEEALDLAAKAQYLLVDAFDDESTIVIDLWD